VRKQQDPNQLSVPAPNAGCSLAKLSFVPNPVVLSSIILPVIVNREQWKCVSGNVINLLEYINHFNSSVKVEISKCDFNSMSISSVKLIMKKCNYEIFILPQEINFSLLQSFVLNLGLPMLLSLTLSYAGVEYKHIIGISPFKETPSSEVTYHIIDYAHSKRMAIEFSEDNLIGVVRTIFSVFLMVSLSFLGTNKSWKCAIKKWLQLCSRNLCVLNKKS
jgi:hypothetical protein